MATNGQGLFKSVDDLPDEVHAALDATPHLLKTWRTAYNAAASNPKYQAKALEVAWQAVGRIETTSLMKVFSWQPLNKRLNYGEDNDETQNNSSFQFGTHNSGGGKDEAEPADVDNPNAASPEVAEAAGQGFNTTDPMEDAPQLGDQNPFGFAASQDHARSPDAALVHNGGLIRSPDTLKPKTTVRGVVQQSGNVAVEG